MILGLMPRMMRKERQYQQQARPKRDMSGIKIQIRVVKEAINDFKVNNSKNTTSFDNQNLKQNRGKGEIKW